jgi:tRNA (guanine37-N1)-methyltransferase
VSIDVFTLFPSWFGWFTEQRHVRNALAEGLELDFVDLRATTPLRAGQVDDTPYGGGAGMVIRVDVVEAALEARYGRLPTAGAVDPAEAAAARAPTAPAPAHAPWAQRRVVALAPGGRQFDDALAAELAREPALTLLCGRYEGFDERVNTHLATDVVSIGPYVLAGGELAAMVVCDAVIRKLPGALGHADSALEESFSPALEGAPEYPHYTRPLEWRGHRVPEILLSGDHARVAAWRMEQSRERARTRAGEE